MLGPQGICAFAARKPPLRYVDKRWRALYMVARPHHQECLTWQTYCKRSSAYESRFREPDKRAPPLSLARSQVMLGLDKEKYGTCTWSSTATIWFSIRMLNTSPSSWGEPSVSTVAVCLVFLFWNVSNLSPIHLFGVVVVYSDSVTMTRTMRMSPPNMAVDLSTIIRAAIDSTRL